MKYFLMLFIFSFSPFSFGHETILLNQEGFPVCFSKNKTTYFFSWDQVIHTKTKPVYYFERNNYVQATGHFIRTCKDFKYLQSIPQEILINLNKAPSDLFPAEILFALNQVAQGAHEFYPEKDPTDYIKNHKKFFQADQAEVLSQLRYRLGDLTAQQVIKVWSDQLFSQTNSCDEWIGTCDFYLCQEQKNPCGLDGYNLNYGYKYCSHSKFSLLPKMETVAGRQWVKNVFMCLQKKNFEDSNKLFNNLKCEAIQTASINSHSDCYVEAGFCNLKNQEKIKILNLIKKEIFLGKALLQGFEIFKQCQEQK